MVSAGSSLSVSLPCGTILAVVAVVMLAVGVIVAVPKVRRWIWAKIERRGSRSTHVSCGSSDNLVA